MPEGRALNGRCYKISSKESDFIVQFIVIFGRFNASRRALIRGNSGSRKTFLRPLMQ
jgi:hypothetical protein